jgi:ADP-ribose pyrophosphatase
MPSDSRHDLDEVLFRGSHLTLRRRGSWEYVERRGQAPGVLIVATTADDVLLLIEEFRPPVDARVVSLPAGLVGDEGEEETPEAAARRELLEETGYECTELEYLGGGPSTPGLASEMVGFYRARDVRKVAEPRAEEEIVVHQVPLDDAVAWTRRRASEGVLIHPMLWAGLLLAGEPREPG